MSRRSSGSPPRNEEELPSAPKQCGCCKHWMRVVINESFNIKRGAVDGVQPWCRRCDAIQKQAVEKRWPIFLREMQKRGRGEDLLWTAESYIALLDSAAYLCRYCGADVREWSGGYSIDKIDPHTDYLPANSVVCCQPCNFIKSDRHEAVFREEIRPLLDQYGRGKIPWQLRSPRFGRVEYPNIAPYIVEGPQMSLFCEPTRRTA